MEGTRVCLRLIHTDVWLKPSQRCKVIILQIKHVSLKKNKQKNIYIKTKISFPLFHFPCDETDWVSQQEKILSLT